MAIKVGMWLISVSLGFAAPALIQAQSPVGIPRELARQRAQRVSDVRYKLSYVLAPKAPATEGT